MNDLELDVKLLRYVAITEREHKEVFSNALHRVIDFCEERIYEEPILKHLLRMMHEEPRMFSKRGWSPPPPLGAPDC